MRFGQQQQRLFGLLRGALGKSNHTQKHRRYHDNDQRQQKADSRKKICQRGRHDSIRLAPHQQKVKRNGRFPDNF